MADDYNLDDEDDLAQVLGAYAPPPPYQGDIDTPESLRAADEYNARRRQAAAYVQEGPQPAAPYEQQGPNPAPPYEEQGPQPQPAYEQEGPQPAAPYEQQGPQYMDPWEQYMLQGRQNAKAGLNAAGQPFDTIKPGYGSMRNYMANQGYLGYGETVGPGAGGPQGFGRMSVLGGQDGGPQGGAAGVDEGHMRAVQHLRNLEQIVLNNPSLSPQTKQHALGRIYDEAAQLAKEHLKQGGTQAFAQQGEFSPRQQQMIAKLDNGENNIGQMHARGEVDDEGYNAVMMQIAQQRQAVRAQAVPKGPTMQERFAQDVQVGADGNQYTPHRDQHGNITHWEPLDSHHNRVVEELVKQGNSPLAASQHAAAVRLKEQGKLTPEMEAALPPLKGKDEAKEQAALEKYWDGWEKSQEAGELTDQQFLAHYAKIEDQAMKQLQETGDPNKPNKVDPGGLEHQQRIKDMLGGQGLPGNLGELHQQRMQRKQQRMQQRAAGLKAGKAPWEAMGDVPQGAAPAPPGGTPGAAQPDVSVRKAWARDIQVRAFAAGDMEVEDAALKMQSAIEDFPGGILTVPRARRAQVIGYLKAMQKYDPTIKIPTLPE